MTLKSWIRRRLGDIDRAKVDQLKRQVRALRQELRAARSEARRVDTVSRQAAKAAQVEARRVAKLSRHAEKIARAAGTDRERLARSTVARQRMKRQMLSSGPLAGVMAARRRHFPAASLRADAEAREARFQTASPAYAAALAQPWPRPGVQAVDLDGLRLWIPLDERQPERLARAAAQDIPLGAILQSREVGIGGVMLDIGANLGRTSLPRVLLGDVRAVYGAEADADNYACLVRAVIDNGLRGFVLPDHLAISADDGVATLRRSRYVGGHRLVPDNHPDDFDVVSVRARRVDSWIADLGIEPAEISFVKVDVQGWEPGVLKGAPGLLATRAAAWQLEVDPHLLRVAGSNVADVVALARPHFTHFLDIRADAPGARHRPIDELAEALAYLPDDTSEGTDVIFYCAGPGPVSAAD